MSLSVSAIIGLMFLFVYESLEILESLVVGIVFSTLVGTCIYQIYGMNGCKNDVTGRT